jgi:hypothetical protein
MNYLYNTTAWPKELMMNLVDESTEAYWQFSAACDHNSETVQLGPYLKKEGAWQAIAALVASLEMAFRCCPRCQDWVSAELEWSNGHKLCYECLKNIREARPLKNLGENPIPRHVATMLYKQLLNLDDPTPLWFPSLVPFTEASIAG